MLPGDYRSPHGVVQYVQLYFGAPQMCKSVWLTCLLSHDLVLSFTWEIACLKRGEGNDLFAFADWIVS